LRGVDLDLSRMDIGEKAGKAHTSAPSDKGAPSGEKKRHKLRRGEKTGGAVKEAVAGAPPAAEGPAGGGAPSGPGPAAPVPAAPPAAGPAATDSTAESESGRGVGVCAYGVEVVELLEMEPLDENLEWPRRSRPWNRYASAAFFLVFILGALNAGAVLLYYSPILTPDQTAGGACEVAGEVRDSAGNPIINATVVVTDSTRSAFTNADGWYVLKGIPAGVHRIEAAAVGYNTMSVRTDLRPSLLKSIDFTLEKGGPDVRLDETGSPDFSEAGNSFLWATPLLLAFSVMGLAAAILALRRKVSRTVLFLGALSALSFGFGMGSVVAVLGVLLAALQLREREGPPLKKLRVGMSYPCKPLETAPPRTPSHAPGVTIKEKYSVGLEECEQVQEASSELIPEKAREPLPGKETVPQAKATLVEPPAPAGKDYEEVKVYLKEKSLAAKIAAAEIEPSATLGMGEVEHETAPRPRRFVRRSKKGRVLCFLCVNEIGQGSEYIRCSCGKTMHLHCLKEPRCPDCGCSFRKGG